jgi:hypothetical protein
MAARGGQGYKARVPPRSLALMFALALGLRLIVAIALYLGGGADAFLIADSGDYLAIARGELASTQFMPLYPWFLRAHVAMFGPSPVWPVMSQLVVDSATCVVAARLAAVLDARLALPAGLLAAINPVQVVMATLVLTETVFVFFCALALWAAFEWLRAPRWQWSAAIGLAVGFAILTRAMLVPWALGLVVVLMIAARVLGPLTRARAGQAVLAAAVALAIQVPVVLDNHARHGGWGLTAQGGTYALLWVVPLVMEAKDGTPHAEGARQMQERFAALLDAPAERDPYGHSRALSRAAFGVLAELGPVPIAKAWAIGAAINLFAPAVILTQPVRTLPRTGFYATPGRTKLDKVRAFLFENDNPLYGWVLLAAAVGTLAWRAVQALGLWRGVRAAIAGDRVLGAALVLLMVWIGYILAVNGPLASAKYRAPIEPALMVLAALAIRPPPVRGLAR